MSQRAFARIAAVAATLVVLLVLGLAVFLILHNREGPEDADTRNRRERSGFHEDAEGAGITFRMTFLSTEQGENFRVNLYDHGCGIAIADFDGDGHDDIYFVNQLGRNALYRNNKDGTFTDVTKKAGVAVGDRICVAAVFADTRNNGWQDLYITSTRGGNLFFRNMGDGTFKEATGEAGLTHIGHSQGALFFDYDNDGYLDLLVTNTARWTKDYDAQRGYFTGKSLDDGDFLSSPKEWNVLYHNNGDGTFTDVTAKSGLKGRGWGGDAVVLDYDDDGRPDVFITNMFGPSQLYHNNGNGTFTDVTKQVLGRTSCGGTGARAFDFNNDGQLDLFLVDMHSDMWMGLDENRTSEQLARRGQRKKYDHFYGPRAPPGGEPADAADRRIANLLQFRLDEVVFGNTFFKNLGGGKFEEVSDQAGLESFWPWGIASGDFDNDGFEDVFLPSGMGYPFYYWPNQLLMNTGRETFRDRAEDVGIEPPPGGLYLKERIGGTRAVRSSRCAATLYRDGRLDLVVNNFNDRAYYFRNHFPEKNYIAFRLTGARKKGEPPGAPGSNRDAIGAVVRLHVGKEVLTRQVCPVGGYLSQSSKTLHFGLGERTKVDYAEIRWPGWPPDRFERIDNPAINTLHERPEPRPTR
ncbi:MAG: CRTAC1 family protein [Planctomycetes bacterium]|nr:CRTAC1 family protein [Planctomycetota bacterium]